MATRQRKIVFLMMKEGALFKTRQFRDPIYVGDPVNTIKIFNDFQVDELVLVDADCTAKNEAIKYDLLTTIGNNARMPITYGGGITVINQIKRLLELGFEKVLISNAAIINPKLIFEATSIFGSQAVMTCVDLKYCAETKRYDIFTHNGLKKRDIGLKKFVLNCIESRVGEILLNSIDADGSYKGLDKKIIEHLDVMVPMPITLLGGASSNQEVITLMEENSINVAAGSLWTFYNKTTSVLLNYPQSV